MTAHPRTPGEFGGGEGRQRRGSQPPDICVLRGYRQRVAVRWPRCGHSGDLVNTDRPQPPRVAPDIDLTVVLAPQLMELTVRQPRRGVSQRSESSLPSGGSAIAWFPH